MVVASSAGIIREGGFGLHQVTSKPVSQASLPRKRMRMLWRDRYLYMLLLPVLAYYIIFKYAPLVGLQIAFRDYKLNTGMWDSAWVGLKYFQRLFSSSIFSRVLVNTLRLNIYSVIFGFPVPIILALMFNAMKTPRYKRVLQTISYLPHFVSFVVVYGFVYNFFSAGGFINGLRQALGMDSMQFLGNTRYYRGIFVGSALWKGVGWNAIIYLAALSWVNVELYEAADIDGAGRWRKLWHVTLPSIRPVISIQFVLAMGGILSVNFEQTLVMMNSMVISIAEDIGYHVYKVGLLLEHDVEG